MIKNLDIPIPKEMNKDAKDLIKKLLRKCPFKRLGAGDSESKYDLSDLKTHKFFNGMSFESLEDQTPPFTVEESKFIANKYLNEKYN